MPRVRFTGDFDWSPPEFNGRVTLAFKAGTEDTVTTPCAEAAVASGKAIKVAPKRKSDEAS